MAQKENKKMLDETETKPRSSKIDINKENNIDEETNETLDGINIKKRKSQTTSKTKKEKKQKSKIKETSSNNDFKSTHTSSESSSTKDYESNLFSESTNYFDEDEKAENNENNEIDIEDILKGNKTSIKQITSIDELYTAKNLYKENVKKILLSKKKELIEELRKEKAEILKNIPKEVQDMPYICFLIGLKNSYAGDQIIVKSKIDSVKKKPSVKVMIDEQTIIFEGSAMKVEGKKDELNMNFINGIKKVYEKFFGNKSN